MNKVESELLTRSSGCQVSLTQLFIIVGHQYFTHSLRQAANQNENDQKSKASFQWIKALIYSSYWFNQLIGCIDDKAVHLNKEKRESKKRSIQRTQTSPRL